MFIVYDSGKYPIMVKLYLAYLVNFAEQASLAEFLTQKIKMGFENVWESANIKIRSGLPYSHIGLFLILQ